MLGFHLIGLIGIPMAAHTQIHRNHAYMMVRRRKRGEKGVDARWKRRNRS